MLAPGCNIHTTTVNNVNTNNDNNDNTNDDDDDDNDNATVRRRISWRLPYIVARLAGRESDFLGLSKTSPGTLFCNMCFILLNASSK